MKYFTLIIVFVFISVSFKSKPKAVILEYDDLGPSILSWKTIGLRYYKWNSGSGGEENQNIKIVIYEGELKDVQTVYKDDKSKPVDYRFLSKKQAIKYFKDAIKEVKKTQVEEKVDLSDMLSGLESALKKIKG